MHPTLAPAGAGRRLVLAATLTAAAALVLAACGSSYGGSPSKSSYGAPATVGPGTTGPAAAVATVDLGIMNFKFTPASVSVRAGATVGWTNKDGTAHTVTFTQPAVSSGTLNPHNQFTHVFTEPGTFAYHCEIHPFMHGTIVVTA